MNKSKIKIMLIRYFDFQGVIHKELVSQGLTVNQHFYREVLERLRKRVMCVRLNILNTWVLHHALPHGYFNYSIFGFQKYSCGLSTSFFARLEFLWLFLFPWLKIHLKEWHFETLENIQISVTNQLKTIPVSEFQNCYEQLKHRL